VNVILDAYPAAVMVKEENCGLTPLHMGRRSGTSLDTMESVSKASPEVARTNQYYGEMVLVQKEASAFKLELTFSSRH
jgi:hypothetical protein